MIEIDPVTRRPLSEFVYIVDAVPEEPVPPDAYRDNGLVELVALVDNGSFLALER